MADANISITPRGAGSGLAGGAIGDGLIVDFSRYNRGISALDLDQRSVRVGAAMVLDQLNASQAAWFLFRSRCRDQLMRDHRRHDRE